MPTSDQLTAFAAIIAALTGLVTAVTALINRRTINSTAADVADVHTRTATENGSTIGENSDAVRNVIAPKSPPADGTAQPAA